ncbi:DNA polymerase III subunit delta [Facklamia miroungae]|uniref:DNA polymerase III subunit delta n=1 Tax=Facklamia miroungae TaxID=120956 RepID=A0A1G7PT70_9LACT|nr:DNA polymerase III subunit delta [Facklamia miroungae]NKZ28819.1 DNA polymerase III subunit delta [Facklamia miroungae]SDF89438.1 DNA polymerase III, delta subunit [Facklamia miroungae]
MDFQNAIQELDKGIVKPFYCLQGSEVYLQQTFRQALAQKIETSTGELDVTSFDWNEVSLDTILDEAETYSFFVDQRLIIVDQVDLLISQPNKKMTESETQRLVDYLKDPNPSTCILFIVPFDQIDKRRKLTKCFVKETRYINISPLEENAVQTFIQTYIQSQSFEMTPEAQKGLLQRVDYQLSQAVTEVQKLKQFAQSGQKVTLEVVQSLVTRSLTSDVFELTNAILAGKLEPSIQIYQDLILMKHDPIQLHALIVSQFRLFVQVKILQRQGMRQDEIAKSLAVHPYRVKLALQASRQMHLNELSQLYLQLVEADYQMKTGLGSKDTSFYLILTKIMQL